MDIKEIPKSDIRERHPWEVARALFVKKLLGSVFKDLVAPKILDIGCGDGFLISEIVADIENYEGFCVDTELTDVAISVLSEMNKKLQFSRDLISCDVEWADVLLLLDVVEHQENDAVFLQNVVDKYMKKSSVILITVPAFNSLFSSHDNFLGHYRRYSRSALMALIHRCGLAEVKSGYAFSSLLWPRIFTNLIGIFHKDGYRVKHLGDWNHGAILTKAISTWLQADNEILATLSRRKLHVPGLTTWALCKKR